MTDNARLAQLLFPNITKTIGQYQTEIFPQRKLPEGACVTRFAPSPTGFIHIGNIFGSMVDERLAHQSAGVCILRIEDTDKKREVTGGVDFIVKGLADFGITFDEGATSDTDEIGAYGPYTQSRRREIYHAFCKKLVEDGNAYPCFCTEERLGEIRAEQEQKNETPGYWGDYANACRNRGVDEVSALIKQGVPYVIRLRSPGKPGGRVKLRDVIRGEIEMEENFIDVVLLKSDGIPTYHFAHVVDDTLMGITQVIRGDEWVSSAPIHLQLFWLLGIKPPKYAHISPIMKEENGAKRKLSKRKDPEAAVSFFIEQGYPSDALMEYLLTIANSNFEDWRRQNKDLPYTDFPFSLKKMSQSGALFDMDKLSSVSAGVISMMDAKTVCHLATEWAKAYNQKLYTALTRDTAYSTALFAIDRGGKKPRKDIVKWSDIEDYVSYFYDSLYARQREDTGIPAADQKAVLKAYLGVFDAGDDKDTWFNKIKELCAPLGFCADTKEYKASPESYKGSVSDVSTVIRVAVTGRKNTPDLHAIMALLGQETVKNRICEYIEEM